MNISRVAFAFGLVIGASLTGCTLKPKSEGMITLLFDAPSRVADSLTSGDPAALFDQLNFSHALATPPATAAGFACYGVNVVGPGILDTSANPDPIRDLGPLLRRETTCAYKGITAGPAYPGAGTVALTARVPAGSDRLVQVIGINNAAYCQSNFLENDIAGSDPEAYELGRARVNVFNDMSLTIANDYTSAVSANRRVDCGGGGSGCSVLSSATAPLETGIHLSASSFGYQPFTGTIGQKVSRITVRLGKSAIPQTVTLRLMRGTPNGTEVGNTTASLLASTIQDVNFQWTSGSELPINFASTYWIRIEPSANLEWMAGGPATPALPTPPKYGAPASAKDIMTAASNPVSISAGSVNTCAVGSGGDLRCAGEGMIGTNGETEYGSADKPVFGSPVTLDITPNKVIVGYDHVCAVDSTGNVRCWGQNDYGQLGAGSFGTPSSVPLTSGPTSVKKLSAGYQFNCALMNDNSVRCWGFGTSYRIGDNNITHAISATRGPSGLTTANTALDIAAGMDHACAVLADTSVACWGGNVSGQIGDGTNTVATTPQPVSGLTGISKVTAGNSFSCALKTSDGSVKCWGENGYGQLGNGTTTDSATPVAVWGITNATKIVAGSDFACALFSDKTVKCWGNNSVGQLGVGNFTTSNVPVPVKDASNSGSLVNVDDLTAGAYGIHACARIGPDPVCWGSNTSGQLAIGRISTTQNYPVPSSFLRSLSVKVENCAQ